VEYANIVVMIPILVVLNGHSMDFVMKILILCYAFAQRAVVYATVAAMIDTKIAIDGPVQENVTLHPNSCTYNALSHVKCVPFSVSTSITTAQSGLTKENVTTTHE
jgi:hypothetical protein